MSAEDFNDIFDLIIVGGGIHGTHLAVRFMEKHSSCHKCFSLWTPT